MLNVAIITENAAHTRYILVDRAKHGDTLDRGCAKINL